ncbi:MAG: heavy metal translocating P-type ATPase [Slackia sp.]|nr:heavy metal translocating P-type ATPase [Slackia sp.]
MNTKLKRRLRRIIAAIALFVAVMALDETGALRAVFGDTRGLYAAFALYLVPYLIAGYDVLIKAWRTVRRGDAFDENFLMAVATIGAFAMVAFPDSDPHMAEGAAVMLFYQVGELFQSYAVGKSRASIAAMMDIAPDRATVERDGRLVTIDPDDAVVGDILVIKPGERVALDGVVVQGTSRLDTAALTGESMPRSVEAGSDVVSGCINMTGVLRVRVAKPYGESTVSRILELVENASERKARTENFITSFARVYTPIVTFAALAIALVPPALGFGAWSDWILRGLTFLVVSCPCALVISVPLSFFGGIGGASRQGILVKGSNYLEALSRVDTVVFDKTGTLTSGTFGVVDIRPRDGIDGGRLLAAAAHAEAFSDHPIATSVKRAYLDEAADGAKRAIDQARIESAAEESGRGVKAVVDGHEILAGSDRLMSAHGIVCPDCQQAGTILHVAIDGAYAGYIVIADTVKDDAAQTIADLHAAGVKRCVMLTGDREKTARATALELGLDEYRAQLLPGDKVTQVERLLESARGALAFVGDGINDTPVLTRADVGIAMGAIGSDAAIEAADIVLMDDKPSAIVRAIRIARTTMRIVHQNIVFAIGAKAAILVLAALGIANMWLAVFGDVGVAVIAILNAMRALNCGAADKRP